MEFILLAPQHTQAITADGVRPKYAGNKWHSLLYL